jgi:hypothetical protein
VKVESKFLENPQPPLKKLFDVQLRMQRFKEPRQSGSGFQRNSRMKVPATAVLLVC